MQYLLKVMPLSQRWYPFLRSCYFIKDGNLSQVMSLSWVGNLSQGHITTSERYPYLKSSLHQRWLPFSKSCHCIRDGSLSQSHVTASEMVPFLKVMSLHQRWMVPFLKVMSLHQRWYPFSKSCHCIRDGTLSQGHVTASEMVPFLKVMSLHQRWYPFSKSCHCIRDGTLSQSHISPSESVHFLKVMSLHQRWCPFSKSYLYIRDGIVIGGPWQADTLSSMNIHLHSTDSISMTFLWNYRKTCRTL